jgi:hypothetical protein
MTPGVRSNPLTLIPSEYSGLAKVVHCPGCRAVLMLVLDETGRGTAPLEVRGWDLAESLSPGFWNLKGGWIHATAHRCRRISGPSPRSSGIRRNRDGHR